MRRLLVSLSVVLTASSLLSVAAAEQPGSRPEAPADARYPVPMAAQEALRQKEEMRDNLVALREVLAALAEKDYVAVEKTVRRLGHQDATALRPGASTESFRTLDQEFGRAVEKTVEAARRQDTDAVLRELAGTISYCQSCHMAFRQSVEGKPAPPAAD